MYVARLLAVAAALVAVWFLVRAGRPRLTGRLP